MKRYIACLIIFCMLVLFSSCDGIYIGDGWQDSPEKALAVAADGTIEDKVTLTPTKTLDEWHIDDMAFMLFVSEADTLVEAEFVTNDKGEFYFQGHSEEALLDKPDTLILNGDSGQFILNPYCQHGKCVWGYKYSSFAIKVNGQTPEIKTYTFKCQGKEWSIDRWQVNGIEENTEIKIEYIS